MKRIVISACLFLTAFGIANAVDTTTTTTTTGTIKTENCGEMMKGLIPLPTKFEELMTAVSEGMSNHAAWMKKSTDKNAKTEAKMLTTLAQDHMAVAHQMKKIIKDMETASTMAPAPHDMSKADPKSNEMMLKQAKLEREMAALMLKHADDTEKMVADMGTESAKK